MDPAAQRGRIFGAQSETLVAAAAQLRVNTGSRLDTREHGAALT